MRIRVAVFIRFAPSVGFDRARRAERATRRRSEFVQITSAVRVQFRLLTVAILDRQRPYVAVRVVCITVNNGQTWNRTCWFFKTIGLRC